MGRIGLGDIVGTPQAKTANIQSMLEGISIIMAHERGTAEMYRHCSADTLDTTLQRQWRTFGEKAQVHVQVTEGVIAALQGDAGYRSPAALEVERCTQTMLSLGIQGEQADLLRLSNLVALDQVSIGYWRGVESVASQTKDPSLTRILHEAAATVERDKHQHLNWNNSMLHRYVTKVMTGH